MSKPTPSPFSGPRTFIIRPLDGQNQEYDNVPDDATVRSLKERVFNAEGIPIEDQKLIYGAEIMDGWPLFSPSLPSYMVLHETDSALLKTPGPSNPTTSATASSSDSSPSATLARLLKGSSRVRAPAPPLTTASSGPCSSKRRSVDRPWP